MLDNIEKIKKTKNAVFRFESLLTHMFFYATRKFPGLIIWDNSKCVMKLVIQCYMSKPKNARDDDIDRMIKNF